MQSYFRRSTNSEIAVSRMYDVKGDNHSQTFPYRARDASFGFIDNI
jgi:hypothetical protein